VSGQAVASGTTKATAELAMVIQANANANTHLYTSASTARAVLIIKQEMVTQLQADGGAASTTTSVTS
jgi:hypothetical protein